MPADVHKPGCARPGWTNPANSDQWFCSGCGAVEARFNPKMEPTLENGLTVKQAVDAAYDWIDVKMDEMMAEGVADSDHERMAAECRAAAEVISLFSGETPDDIARDAMRRWRRRTQAREAAATSA